MKKIANLTEEQRLAFANKLNNEYNIDTTYQDFAEVCFCLAANCEVMLKDCPECLDDDAIAIKNTEYLRDMLELCAKMFYDCDDYFRALENR